MPAGEIAKLEEKLSDSNDYTSPFGDVCKFTDISKVDEINDDFAVAIFSQVKNIFYYAETGVPLIGICDESDIGDMPFSCHYIFTDISRITERDVDLAFCRSRHISAHIMDFKYQGKSYYLRELNLSDVDDLFKLYESPHFTDFMEGLFEYETEVSYQKNYIEQIYEVFDYGQWLLFEGDMSRDGLEKNCDLLIGRFGVESRESCVNLSQVEIGYALRYDRRGCGLATFVCKKIIDYTFNVLDKESIIARVDEENIPSLNLIKRLGFVKSDDIYIRRKNPDL